MSLKDDLKKLLFGAKSAAKSAGRKAEEQGRAAGEDLKNTSKAYYDKAKERMEDLDKEYRPKAKKAVDDARSFAEELVDEAWKKGETWLKDEQTSEEPAKEEKPKDPPKAEKRETTDFSETFSGKQPYEFKEEEDGPAEDDSAEGPKRNAAMNEAKEEFYRVAGEVGRKAGEFSERVGEQVLRKSDEINAKLSEQGAKAWEKAQEVGGRLMHRFDELVDKANEEAAKESMDELTKQAKEMDDELERRVKERGKRSNVENLERDSKEGTLGGFDSFFDKAERYAEGDYHNRGEEDIRIGKDPDYKPKDKTGTVKGFEDLDGDGDEIIDDAIIDDEEDPKNDKPQQ
jgi:hypothetical protein